MAVRLMVVVLVVGASLAAAQSRPVAQREAQSRPQPGANQREAQSPDKPEAAQAQSPEQPEAARREARPSFERGQVNRAEVRRPDRELPGDLRLRAPRPRKIPEVPEAEEAEGTSKGSGSGNDRIVRKPSSGSEEARSHTRPHPIAVWHISYDEEAARAGAWAARELCMSFGRTEYLKAGLHDGMRAAIDNHDLGRWDFDQGQSRGRNDRDAWHLGSQVGAEDAEYQARAAAAAQVEAQFRVLGREPYRNPMSNPPFYEPDHEWVARPELTEVFHEVGGGRIRGSIRDVLSETGASAWSLFHSSDYSQALDGAWYHPERAFDFWLDDHRRSSVYRGLPSRTFKERFRAVFEHEYARQLEHAFNYTVLPAYNQGYAAGWDYGIQVNYEWHYRDGYAQGYNATAAEAAEQSFASSYVSAYLRAYDEAFNHWLYNPHPELLELSLRDASDDGIFEPGEELLADFALVNYGGAGGDLDLQLSGPDLLPARSQVQVPARDELRRPQPIQARIRPGARVRSLSLVDLCTGEQCRSTDLLVSYPLEMDDGPLLAHRDNLAGRARFEVRVSNRSRKPVTGEVELARVDLVRAAGHSIGDRQPLEMVYPGETTSTWFDLEVPPIELIGGGVGAHFEVRSGGKVHDEAVYRFTDAASNLGNRDLLLLLVARAGAARISPHDTAALHDLVLRRLRVDWDAVARAKGNPYKDDYKGNTGTTALGDLVRTFLDHRDRMQRPELFTGLRPQIEHLVEQLPGAHPFLRKYMRRLAARLE
jgi:hypothetical protein